MLMVMGPFGIGIFMSDSAVQFTLIRLINFRCFLVWRKEILEVFCAFFKIRLSLHTKLHCCTTVNAPLLLLLIICLPANIEDG